MLPSPSSSPRAALAPCTNTLRTPQTTKSAKYLPTPPIESKTKRHRPVEHKSVNKSHKRLKLEETELSSDSEQSDYDEEEDVAMKEPESRVPHVKVRKSIPHHLFSRFITSPVMLMALVASSLPILQSFVSSNKSDVFKCHSVGGDTYLTPPYACSYSSDAKAGGKPLLAVATEQGTVHIFDTTRRKDWDCEIPRTTYQPHFNGIFDIKWNLDGRSLATCSGDQSTRITSAETGVITNVLRGHTSTVKCLSWDPSNTSLLATGGRDGAICLWDLRVGERVHDTETTASAPVMTIFGAHENTTVKSKPKSRKGKQNPSPRTVTNLLYPGSEPFSIVSSGSFDGILRCWDLRTPATPKKKTAKLSVPTELYSSLIDPTTRTSKRARGILSMTTGTGPSAGLIFAFSADSRIHIYDLPSLNAHNASYSHENLQTSSFYVGLSVSPCGRWLACGGSPNTGNSFLFDVENASGTSSIQSQGVELKGQMGEVGSVDWAAESLATCADDGTVRVWRPDLTTHIKCREQPEESSWDWSWSM
ncbi:Denticleless protein-like protein A [Psilocybe cubensis]|uniref:Denticleless protein-like protein A n=2 Tax=Psilocybe cubensis TaxID=181762 RepID=A0ACB8H3V5_PSICU|nr:Denticleless protein-like protein A [Psilocybe cubensis]KAH9482588.1 Denticleless protein-like protein A [Psilocybe cubensis]